MEVALCCAKELANKEIAFVLGISERAVKGRLRAVRFKIGASGQTGIAYAVGRFLMAEEHNILDHVEFR